MISFNDATFTISSGNSISNSLELGNLSKSLSSECIETYLLNKHMDGLMDGSRVRGIRAPNELSGF